MQADNKLVPLLIGGTALLAGTILQNTQPAWADLEVSKKLSRFCVS
jgi:hypothetical protein